MNAGDDMAELKPVQTEKAPGAIGPYSQGMITGNLVFTAGQIALDPATGRLVEGDIAVQTDRVFQNLEAVLAEAGASLQSVVKTTVFLASMDDFAAMNDVYARYMGDHKPARSAVEVARLPKAPEVLVEIEAVAVVG